MNNGRKWRFPSADASNALATLLLVAVGIFGVLATLRSLELSERAWVGIGGFGVTAPATSGQPLHYAIIISNPGKEPAVDTAFSQDTGSTAAPANNDFANFSAGDNDTCNGIEPVKGGGVLVPGGAMQHNTDTGRGTHPVTVDERFLTGQTVVVAKGCVAYRTFNKVHRTAYCSVFELVPMINPPNAAPSPNIVATSTPAAAAAASTPSPVQVVATPPDMGWMISACPSGNSAD